MNLLATNPGILLSTIEQQQKQQILSAVAFANGIKFLQQNSASLCRTFTLTSSSTTNTNSNFNSYN